MAAKPRRPTKKSPRRAPAPRSRSGLKLLTAIGLLFFVFCAAAGATLWFVAAPNPLIVTNSDPPPAHEGFSTDERKALEDVLRQYDAGKK